jgi:ketosteroid isomerase-like protein
VAEIDELKTISIQRACERLVADFAYFSDHQDYEALANLFAVDAVMTRPSGDAISGRTAILAAYRSRPASRLTRHFCTNVRITVESGDHAHGHTYALVYSGNAADTPEGQFGIKADARSLIGEFEDEFVRTQEGWRFRARVARFVIHTV